MESAVFFDELIRTGRDKQMTSPARANSFRTSRLIPAVEYLQAQRARAMMMAKLAEATADVGYRPTPGVAVSFTPVASVFRVRGWLTSNLLQLAQQWWLGKRYA